MKILALIHGFPPGLNAGGEYYMFNFFKFLVERGHFVQVRIAQSDLVPYEIDGISVGRDVYPETKKDLLTTDLIITHLNRQGFAMNLAEFNHKPCVVVQHNHNVSGSMGAKHKPHAHERWLYCIHNTQHVADKCKYPNPSIIMHPPVYEDRVKVKKPGGHITLINCWDKKGGDVFHTIASRMPDKKFLGVEGGYAKSKQLMNPAANVEYVQNTPDIKSVYSKTRILLMPSVSESYGMAAIEAAVSGIPTIAAPTPGLRESLGDAGIFVERDNIDGWIEAIKRLDDPDEYKAAAAKVKARFKAIASKQEAEMLAAEKFLQDAIKRVL